MSRTLKVTGNHVMHYCGAVIISSLRALWGLPSVKKQKHDFQCIIAASHQASSNTNVCTTGSVCYVCHKKSRFPLDLRLCLDDFRSDFRAQWVLSTLPWRQPDFWWPSSIAESSYSNRDFGMSSTKESDLERQASKFNRRNWSKLLLCVTAVCAWSKKTEAICDCMLYIFYFLCSNKCFGLYFS